MYAGCGMLWKNPHLQVAIPHLWRLHLIPAVFRRIILCACIRKTVWKIGLYRVWAGQSPGYNVSMPGGKLSDVPCKMCLSLMYFFVFRLRAVRPAAGNRTARNWQPHGPQLENGVLVDAQRGFIQCIVTFMLRHIGILPLPLESWCRLFLCCQPGYKSPLHPLSLMDKGMWRVKGECV